MADGREVGEVGDEIWFGWAEALHGDFFFHKRRDRRAASDPQYPRLDTLRHGTKK